MRNGSITIQHRYPVPKSSAGPSLEDLWLNALHRSKADILEARYPLNTRPDCLCCPCLKACPRVCVRPSFVPPRQESQDFQAGSISCLRVIHAAPPPTFSSFLQHSFPLCIYRPVPLSPCHKMCHKMCLTGPLHKCTPVRLSYPLHQ